MIPLHNNGRRKIYLFLFLLLPLTLDAQIYEYNTSKGNVIFTDRAPSNKGSTPKPINCLPQINTFPLKSNNADHEHFQPTPPSINMNDHDLMKRNFEQKVVPQKIAIISPNDQQTFWNERQIIVNASVTPELVEGNTIQILLDGSPYQSPKAQLQFKLETLGEGSHTIQAELLGLQKEILSKTQRITFFIHNGKVEP